MVFDDDKKNNDDDDTTNPKSPSKEDAGAKESTKPPPSTLAPKDGKDKGNGVAQGQKQAHEAKDSSMVMEVAMKGKF